MTDILRLSTATKQARAAQWPTRLAGGTLVIYDGTWPASTDDAVTTQAALVTFTVPGPAGESASGIFTGATLAAAMISATGTAGWARAYTSGGVADSDWTVGLVGSGAAVELDNLSLAAGGLVAPTTWGITEG